MSENKEEFKNYSFQLYLLISLIVANLIVVFFLSEDLKKNDEIKIKHTELKEKVDVISNTSLAEDIYNAKNDCFKLYMSTRGDVGKINSKRCEELDKISIFLDNYRQPTFSMEKNK